MPGSQISRPNARRERHLRVSQVPATGTYEREFAMEGFDVFSGRIEREPMWLETARSVDEAIERMKDRARTKPGPYFVYCCESSKVVESIDTSEPPDAAKTSAA
jgi:hypothetical protein